MGDQPVLIMACVEWVLLNEIAQPEVKRDDIADTYRAGLVAQAVAGEQIDWAKVNAAIMARWSRSGLEYIKVRAWQGLR